MLILLGFSAIWPVKWNTLDFFFWLFYGLRDFSGFTQGRTEREAFDVELLNQRWNQQFIWTEEKARARGPRPLLICFLISAGYCRGLFNMQPVCKWGAPISKLSSSLIALRRDFTALQLVRTWWVLPCLISCDWPVHPFD